MFEHLPIKRRRVLRGFLAGGIIAFAAPFVYAASKFLSYSGILGGSKITKVPLAELTPEQPAKFVEVEGEPVIIVLEPAGQVRAFTATCTHMGCIVNYRPELLIGQTVASGFYCRCHGGKFDSDGVNVPGTPPKTSLTELAVINLSGVLSISLTPKTKAT